MPLTFDQEFLKAVEPVLAATAGQPKPALHDVQTRRDTAPAFIKTMIEASPPRINTDGIKQRKHIAKASDGHEIAIYEFYNANQSGAPTAGIVHLHGGGMIWGDVAMGQRNLFEMAAQTSAPVFAVEYRLAPDFPHPTPVTDCYTGLRWVQEHANDFNVDPARLALVGESAGGGLAACVALMARDKGLPGPPIKKQILIYPMLDNENLDTMEFIEPFAFWSHVDNKTGWNALLEKADPAAPLEYAAAFRAKDLKGLPPAYIDVGTLDIFYKEDIEYANRLIEAGVDTELHVYPGVPHAFELLGPGTKAVNNALANRLQAMLSV